MIPQDTVELILDTARIEEVVGDFVSLKRRGANFVACCPFHNEKTPSFYVSPSKGIFKCFGCGKAGSAVGFVMEQEKCSYTEALRYLAKRYNIEVKEEEETPEIIAARQRNESLLLVSEFAQKFFNSQLESGEGRSVGYAYLRSRGLEDATIAKFGLGWAPSGKTALIDEATSKGYKLEYLVAAGLAVQREDGSYADKFRERVMFPIHSVSGRVVAFSGRTLHADNPAKYVNSPETEIYIKSRNLLGIWFAKSEMARADRCILVEGNVDMVTMHQAGITNVVASCGTSLTSEQIRLIKKFTSNITIMYDGDSAGIHAALRGIDLVLREGMDVRIVLLPEGEDPDSFARKHTLEEVRDYISSHERDFIGFKSELLASEAGSDPLKKAQLINDIADTVADVQDAVKRNVYVEDLAARFNIESKHLYDRISATRRKAREEEQRIAERERRRREAGLPAEGGPAEEPGSSAPAAEPQGPAYPIENRTLEAVEKELLGLILLHGTETLEFETDSPFYPEDGQLPEVAAFIRDSLDADSTTFANSALRATYDAYMEAYEQGLSKEEILSRLYNSSDRRVACVSGDLSIDKHAITVEDFIKSMTKEASWLVTCVPKALLVYAEKRIEDRLGALRSELKTAGPERMDEILLEFKRLTAAQQRIKSETGRDKSQSDKWKKNTKEPW